MRIARTLAIGLLLVSLATFAAPGPSQAAPPPAAQGVALIDLGGLFGEEDENEPDEEEGDEGGSSTTRAQDSSGASLPQTLLFLGLGAVAVVYLARWFFRIRSWVR